MIDTTELVNLISELPDEATCFGYCEQCGEVHYLSEGNSRVHALQLFDRLVELERIDFASSVADPRFSTDYLWGDARGQMFGVLECEDSAGNIVILQAFSCQYNGEWLVDGWVPPLIDLGKCEEVGPALDAEIKSLTTAINRMEKCAPERAVLVQARRKISRDFMKLLHSFYTLPNFAGETRNLLGAFINSSGVPTGAGDCCAPKLLGYAAQNGLKPLGLSEFYFGKTNKSATRTHGEFYPACASKCQPILGYMLCGL